MNKWLRRLLILLALLAPAYYLLVLHSPASGTEFPLDIAKVRALANSVPGAKASELRYEHILTLTFSEAMTMAGEPWRKYPMQINAYQLVFPDTTLMIDSAMNRATAQPAFLVALFDDAAYAHMNTALAKASQIVITHEHMDHIGGIAAHPQLAALLPALRLTDEQLANPAGMKPAVLPAGVMQNYKPIHYDGMLAIAPGVVLIKSPGHTPGSQMVYVQRADGRELLFLGDVSWRRLNIEQLRERPLFMTLIIGEDRDAVLGEFKALHQLMQTEPKLSLVPGHDGEAVKALTDAGLLLRGFKL